MDLIREYEQRGLMAEVKYNMSFTAGSLFFLESQEIAEIYFDYKSWKVVKEKVLSDNLIQSRTKASLKRFNREIIQRLEFLNEAQLALLISGTSQEKKYVLWYALCQKHEFVKEFAIEVLREKFLLLNFKVTYRDFDIFFNKKAEWHEELDQLTTSTRNKLRQVLFRIMREADILLPDDSINTIHLTPCFLESFNSPQFKDFLIFPLADQEIKRLCQ